MGIKKAKTKEIKRVTAAESGRWLRGSVDRNSSSVYLPRAHQADADCSKATPKEAAAKLVEKLKFEARVI